MLRILKQDGAGYTANAFSPNTFMVSNVDKNGDIYSSATSNANAVGTHKLLTISQDVVANAAMENDGIVPHCTRSGRDYLDLAHCDVPTKTANAMNPPVNLPYCDYSRYSRP